MGEEIGPFHVEGKQIARLDKDFSVFLTELLRCEATVNGQLPKMTSTDAEYTADGGVDIFIENYTGTTDWIPLGSSVWQLKRSDYEPAQIENEFARAAYARGRVDAGASYKLVLGVAHPEKLIKARQEALWKVASDHGYIKSDADKERFEVLAADKIAGWASKYPALAVSPALQGRGSVGINFHIWSSSDMYATAWVSDEVRDLAISSIRSFLLQNAIATIRVTGMKGVGKTRLVMEAIRGDEFAPYAIYTFGDDVTAEFLNHLVDPVRDRRAILIVDDCSPETRKKLEFLVRSKSGVKAVIIQPTDDKAAPPRVIPIEAMKRDHITKILEANNMLWREARTFVMENCGGNIKYALWICETIAEQPGGSMANILNRDFIQDFIGGKLPAGQEFLAACLISLFTRVGWDLDLEDEIKILASCFSIPMDVFHNIEIKLQQLRILEKEGRYRTVAPHPVACYMAMEAWKMHGDQIRDVLMPVLSGDFESRFYQRMADLGLFDETSKTIESLLVRNASFASLAAMEASGKCYLLSKMAVVAPDLVLKHLSFLIKAVPLQTLKDMKDHRRELVDTLTKLVWNSQTFVTSADNLLALALAENESWANNASGTWCGLFASVLPSTSASPSERAIYLLEKAESTDDKTLLLIVTAAKKALDPYDASMENGELQGGVIVEARGRPATYSDLYEYQKAMIGLLRQLATHTDAEVASAAQQALVGAIHSSLTVEVLRVALAEAIIDIGADDLSRATSIEVRHLQALFASKETVFDARIEGLKDFTSRLPVLSQHEKLMVLTKSHSWNFDEGVLGKEILDELSKLDSISLRTFLEEVFAIPDLPAGSDLGGAVAEIGFDLLNDIGLMDKVVANNSFALRTFLMKRVEAGELSGFDDFFGGTYGSKQSPEIQYFVMMVAPMTETAWKKISDLALLLPPWFVAANGIPWLQKMSEDQKFALLEILITRIGNQADYDAVVDYASMSLYGKTEASENMQDLLWRLIELRRQFPEVGRFGWAWSRVSKFLIGRYVEEMALLIIELINSDVIHPHREEEEVKVLQKCASASPEIVFKHLAASLTANEWRVSWAVRDWIGSAVPVEVISGWIGNDEVRARLIATVCEVGITEPTPLMEFLLTKFPGEEAIKSDLYSTFWSGNWVGNASDRYQAKIDQLKGWLDIDGLDPKVAEWARRAIAFLSEDRDKELGREAEEGH